jgi:hypothetical protein
VGICRPVEGEGLAGQHMLQGIEQVMTLLAGCRAVIPTLRKPATLIGWAGKSPPHYLSHLRLFTKGPNSKESFLHVGNSAAVSESDES